MIRTLFAFAAFVFFLSAAVAQEAVYTLTLKNSEMNVLWQALQKAPLPREMTDPVVTAITSQIKEQEMKKPPKAETGATK